MGSVRRALLAQLLWLLVVTGCSKPEAERPFPEARARAALASYADIAHALYAASSREAGALRVAVATLVREPSAEALSQAREAWLRARVPYRESEVFRFYEGPIDQVELLVNTWPIDESYVEAASKADTPGIIDQAASYPELSEALLTSLNARDGETSISTGYHVIEYLLWGRDGSLEQPGQRPYTDYVPSAAGAAAARVTRRGRYLELACALLERHLQQVADAWAPERTDNFRARFLALPAPGALGLALRGMGALGGPELSGERLTVPYETRDPENEQSCFSDTTRDDVLGNARGIASVWLGRVANVPGVSVAGVGLRAVFEQLRPELASQIDAHIAESVAAAASIPSPFDRLLVAPDDTPGRRAIARTIAALTAQTRAIERALAELGAPGQALAEVP